ncbi:hypothetical protein FB451DRAFT_1563783 [Mycena latifolia]|nr:hypothetical protein FB451DRAFT_1563783 [Mycena latifolia]
MATSRAQEWKTKHIKGCECCVLMVFFSLTSASIPAGRQMDSAALTYGAILFGGAGALTLSGIVVVQCIIFFELFPDDARVKKLLVAALGVVNLVQTSFILEALSYYFLRHFGDKSALDIVPWSISLALLLTAVQAFAAHLFYAQKIYRCASPLPGRIRLIIVTNRKSPVSGEKCLLTATVLGLATCHLLTAIVAAAHMLHLDHWATFTKPFTIDWFLFTGAILLSAVTDLITTLCLCYYEIQKLSSSGMNGVMGTLALYVLETGLLTCLLRIACLAFWLKVPRSSMSLSLNFIVGKLYPIILLLLLNGRRELKELHSSDHGIHFEPVNRPALYYTDRAPALHDAEKAPVTLPTPPTPTYEYYRPAVETHTVEFPVHRTGRRDSVAIPDVGDLRKHVLRRSLRPGSVLQWPAPP